MIHLVGLPHTSLNEDLYSTCAFTTKAARWTKVLELIGRDVTAYWGGGPNTVNCEVVELLSNDERIKFFGEDVGTRLPDIEWTTEKDYWAVFLYRAVREIKKRIKPGDIVALWMGALMQNVTDTFKSDHVVIEPAVGYEGIAPYGTFACFESYAWMHHRYGAYGINDGRAFDTVIPNFIRREQFKTGKDKGYALYAGRLIMRKGVHVAGDIAERAGLPLVVMGAGGKSFEDGVLTATDGTVIKPVDRYEGVADPTKRAEIMSHASVLITPTLYIEPFGTVHVEAMASGVPVIAPDYGVFTETVEPFVDGFRYRTPAQAAQQIEQIQQMELRGPHLRERTLERFSLEAVAPRFDEWLWRLESLRNGLDGWNSPVYMAPVPR
jgi:glycosyltransferase involved in cell wall biosynthesis